MVLFGIEIFENFLADRDMELMGDKHAICPSCFNRIQYDKGELLPGFQIVCRTCQKLVSLNCSRRPGDIAKRCEEKTECATCPECFSLISFVRSSLIPMHRTDCPHCGLHVQLSYNYITNSWV